MEETTRAPTPYLPTPHLRWGVHHPLPTTHPGWGVPYPPPTHPRWEVSYPPPTPHLRWGVPYPPPTSGEEYLTHTHLPPPTCHLPPWVCGVGSERWVGGGWAGGRWVAGDGWVVAHRPPLEGLTRNYKEIKGTHHPPVTCNYPPLEETAIVNISRPSK